MSQQPQQQRAQLSRAPAQSLHALLLSAEARLTLFVSLLAVVIYRQPVEEAASLHDDTISAIQCLPIFLLDAQCPSALLNIKRISRSRRYNEHIDT